MRSSETTRPAARDADWAFDAYETVRGVLPEARFPAQSVHIPDLAALADRFDVFLLDAFGVLNVGETAIPGAPERVASLQAMGKRVLVITNGATYPAETALAKYARMGFRFAPEDVVASRDALSSALAARPSRRWAAMAVAGSRLDLLGKDIALLGDDPAAYDAAEGFILLGSGDWSDHRQALLIRTLRDRPRPVLVGNPDIVAPRETSLSLEPGWYAHDAARATGVRPEFFGKPFANVFDLAIARLGPGLDRLRVAMVGDTLHTDVLGGRAQGFAAVLVHRHGLFADREIAPYIARSGIRPDFIAEST